MMEYTLKNKCDLFLQNRDTIKNSFPWSNMYFSSLCAIMFARNGRTIDNDKIGQCLKIIKANRKVFSPFRPTPQIALAAMLALEDDSDAAFHNTAKAYTALRSEFRASDYLPFAACTLEKLADEKDYVKIIHRARALYERMGAHHPLMTTYRNVPFAVLLAAESDSDQIINEVERCYNLLKSEKRGSNTYSLSCILALGNESCEEKCGKTVKLLEALYDSGCKYSKRYELPVIGSSVLSGSLPDDIVGSVSEINLYLKEQKGCGAILGKAARLMYSLLLVNSDIQTDEIVGVSGLVSAVSATLAASTASNASTN